jgi:hypothetical protein
MRLLIFTSALLAFVARVVGQEQTCNGECVQKRDWVTRSGLGENEGVPGIEYIGLDYNMLEGNPRGTSKSELDPGYRHRVVDIITNQSRVTLDQLYLMPYGGKLKASASLNLFSCLLLTRYFPRSLDALVQI